MLDPWAMAVLNLRWLETLQLQEQRGEDKSRCRASLNPRVTGTKATSTLLVCNGERWLIAVLLATTAERLGEPHREPATACASVSVMVLAGVWMARPVTRTHCLCRSCHVRVLSRAVVDRRLVGGHGQESHCTKGTPVM